MLHILLIILKIIGMLLIAILGILILLLLLVLFVPLRYEISLESKEEIKKGNVRVKFSWLLHLFSGHVTYENEDFKWKLRIAWKTMEEEKPEPVTDAAEDVVHVTKAKKEEKPEAKQEKKNDIKQEKKVVTEEKEIASEASEEKTGKIEKIKCTMKNIYDKIKIVIEFLKNESHVLAFHRLKKELIRLLKFLKPKKIRGMIHFGMGDPYHTGQVLAGLSMLYPLYGENIEISPDFEEKILKGDLYIKGRVRGVYALVLVWNIILDKHVRATFHDVKSLL